MGLVLLFAACNGTGSGGSPGATPTPTAGTTPTTGPLVCADNSTDQFEEIAAELTFTLYCPTMLPAEFTLTFITEQSSPPVPGSVPNPDDVFIRAVFGNGTDKEVLFQQGILGPDFEGSINQLYAGQPTRTVPYGDSEATFFPSYGSDELRISASVMARGPGFAAIDVRYFITGDIDDETLEEVAATMRAVNP